MKKKSQKCSTPYCRRPRAAKKKFCDCCHQRQWRAAHPIQAQYARLRAKARARGINFCLPFWYFEIFALRSGYITRTGNAAGSLTVDRKNNLLGYVIANIQPLTRHENGVKQAKQDQRRMEIGYAWRSR
jgi:hypothetical protein